MTSITMIKKIHTEIMAYILIGLLTEVITLGTYYLCTSLFLDIQRAVELQIANIISWMVAVVFAYFANKIIVFKSQNPHWLRESFSFITSRIFTLLLSMGLMYIFVTILHLDDKIMKLLVELVVVVLNYLTSKFMVYPMEKMDDTK